MARASEHKSMENILEQVRRLGIEKIDFRMTNHIETVDITRSIEEGRIVKEKKNFALHA